jgi:ABC-type transport system substrate-binding protein
MVMALPNAIDNFNQLQTNSYYSWYFNQLMYPDNGVPTAIGLAHVAVQSYWSNANSTTWYFRVAPGMTWSDGVPANATDLAFSIRTMYTSFKWGFSGSLSGYASLLSGTPQNSVKVDNASVVEVDLRQPFGLLGDIIGTENTPNFTPYHVWGKNFNDTKAPGPNLGTVPGVGPFFVSSYHQGDQQMVLLPNPSGTPWGGDSQGKPFLNKIVVSLVPSSSSLALLLQGGQVDAAQLSPGDVAGLLSNPNIQVAATPGTGLWYIEFPIEHYPYNVDAFRHALAYAIDKNALVTNALAGYGTAATSAFIPASNSPEYNSSVPQYSLNVNTTKQLLQSIGFKLGSDGFFSLPNGTKFQPPIYVPAENTPIVLAGDLVARNLQAAGINAQLRTIATTSMTSVWYQGINMYFENQNFGYPNSELLTDQSFYSFFSTAGPTHGHAFADKKVSKAYNSTVTALEASGSQQTRYGMEQKIQGIIGSYLPSIPLFYPNFIWGFNKAKFAGWPTPPSSIEVPGAVFNLTALSSIHLAGPAVNTTSSAIISTSVGSTSTSAPTGGTDLTLLYVGIVVVVIVAIGVIAVAARRKRP